MLKHSGHDKHTEDNTDGHSTWGQVEAAPDLVWEGSRAECHRSPPGEIKKRHFKPRAWHKDIKEGDSMVPLGTHKFSFIRPTSQESFEPNHLT